MIFRPLFYAKGMFVFFSFLNRFLPKKPKPEFSPSNISIFSEIARETKGHFFSDYKLFLNETVTTIDLLFFLPHRGLYFGEKISWRLDEIKGASVARATKSIKKTSATRFDSTESIIRRKLSDVLSFDSTPCIRFAWLKHIREEEFDALDSSFHEMLPKSRVIFADDSAASARAKLEKLADYQSDPYSALKVIGSLNAHRMLLPTADQPFGAFLSDEQHLFLDSRLKDTVTTLYGAPGSGKSTLLIRKAVAEVLNDPNRKIMMITPTLLAGDLLRNQLISLMEYGAFSVPLDSIAFYTPHPSETLEKLQLFEDSDIILCDDACRLDDSFIDSLKEHRGERWLVLSNLNEPESLENTFFLLNRYRSTERIATLQCPKEHVLFVFLSALRKRLLDTPKHDIIVVLPESEMLTPFKKAIDEYLALNCRILTPDFSLQYQNLDDLLLSTAENISGVSIPHLFLVLPENSDDYTFELSRASETATIIFFSNPHGENDAKDHQK